MEAGLGGRPEVGVRSLLQLADEEPQAHLTVETQEAARLAFNPAQEYREGMLAFRFTSLCTLVPHACFLLGGGRKGGKVWLRVANSWTRWGALKVADLKGVWRGLHGSVSSLRPSLGHALCRIAARGLGRERRNLMNRYYNIRTQVLAVYANIHTGSLYPRSLCLLSIPATSP